LSAAKKAGSINANIQLVIDYTDASSRRMLELIMIISDGLQQDLEP
jgi:hypothetical protein